jgi:RNA polymerase sigma-70 factor (ECF subfamily)
MPNSDKWFDKLYIENSPRMVKMATYLLGNQQIAEELVNEAFLILLYKKSQLVNHPNLAGWLSQTLKNLISDELKSAKHRLELPLNEDIDTTNDDIYEPPLSELLPKGLSQKEQEILILYYEKQLSYAQIASQMHLSILTCRTRLSRARAHYKKLIDNVKDLY